MIKLINGNGQKGEQLWNDLNNISYLECFWKKWIKTKKRVWKV